jgi:endo-1,4-beta-xylanase
MVRALLLLPAILLLSAQGLAVPPEGSPGPAPSSVRPGLKDFFAGDFRIGAAINRPDLQPGELALLLGNFSNITPENCFKPHVLAPSATVRNYGEADRLAAFAGAENLALNAHTLVWHRQAPEWFFVEDGHPAGRETVRKRLRDYVLEVTSRFRGKAASWDVVNEAIGNDRDDYLRKSPWSEALGEDFIAEAFLAAREGDPGAKLYYNDYSIEEPRKRRKTLRLIRNLRARGVPLDGIGIQGHWELDKVPYRDIEEAIVTFHREGLEIAITELDIDVVSRHSGSADTALRESGGEDPYAGGCPVEILQRQADQYGKLFSIFRKHRDKIRRVTFWGLHDGVSWLNGWPRKRTDYPLLFDRNLAPKPSLDAVLGRSAPPTRPRPSP